MKQFDQTLLNRLGITLPDADMKELCSLLTTTHEIRIGEHMSQGLTDAQLCEFEALIDAQDDEAIAQWLDENRPDYQEIIEEEFEILLQEVRENARHIMEAVPPHLSAQEIKKGQVISLGRWPENHPLQWKVLEADRAGCTALLLCTEVIELEEFQPGDKDPSWPQSHMRAWLNGTFLRGAFREREQRYIRKCALSTPGDEKTLRHSDSVFLLSRQEVEIYLKNKSDRRSPASAHAEAQGVSVYGDLGRCYWWMRSGSRERACAVSDEGNMVSTRGVLTDYPGVGLRPAIRIRLQR